MSKKYNTKNNMKQAMYEMFGVGEELNEETQPDEEILTDPEITFDKMMEEYEPAKKLPVTYFAAGTVFEGTLKATGDVEVSGEFNGDILSEGDVILNSAVCGNVNCNDLYLKECTLVGDVEAKGGVEISADSRIRGNITASMLRCAGALNGNLNVVGDTVLEKTAKIHGAIKTETMAMEKGAEVKGEIEVKRFQCE